MHCEAFQWCLSSLFFAFEINGKSEMIMNLHKSAHITTKGHTRTNMHITSQMHTKHLLSLLIHECNARSLVAPIQCLMCWGILGLCGLSLSFSNDSSHSNVSLAIFPLELSLSALSLHLFSLPVSLSSLLLYLTQSLPPPVSLSSIPLSFISALSHCWFSTFPHLHFVLCIICFVCPLSLLLAHSELCVIFLRRLAELCKQCFVLSLFV